MYLESGFLNESMAWYVFCLRRSAVPLEFTVAPKKKDDAGGRLIIIFHYFSKIKFPVQIIAISGPFTLCASIHIIVYIWKLLGVLQCYQRSYYFNRVNNSWVFPSIFTNFNVFFAHLTAHRKCRTRASSTILYKHFGT